MRILVKLPLVLEIVSEEEFKESFENSSRRKNPEYLYIAIPIEALEIEDEKEE